MKLFLLALQIALFKQKEMSRNDEMNMKIQMKTLSQLSTSENFLINNSIEKYLLLLLLTQNYTRSWNHL